MSQNPVEDAIDEILRATAGMRDVRCRPFSSKILSCEPNWTHTVVSNYEKGAFVPTRYRNVARFD
jgi:hypothetical protein